MRTFILGLALLTGVVSNAQQVRTEQCNESWATFRYENRSSTHSVLWETFGLSYEGSTGLYSIYLKHIDRVITSKGFELIDYDVDEANLIQLLMSGQDLWLYQEYEDEVVLKVPALALVELEQYYLHAP